MSFTDNLMRRVTCRSCGFHVEKSAAWIRNNEVSTCPNGHICQVSQFPVVITAENSQTADRARSEIRSDSRSPSLG
jgi:hypothetical protein